MRRCQLHDILTFESLRWSTEKWEESCATMCALRVDDGFLHACLQLHHQASPMPDRGGCMPELLPSQPRGNLHCLDAYSQCLTDLSCSLLTFSWKSVGYSAPADVAFFCPCTATAHASPLPLISQHRSPYHSSLHMTACSLLLPALLYRCLALQTLAHAPASNIFHTNLAGSQLSVQPSCHSVPDHPLQDPLKCAGLVDAYYACANKAHLAATARRHKA